MNSRVTILFRNGSTVRAETEDFTVTTGVIANDLRGIKWANMKPEPLFIDMREVIAIFSGAVSDSDVITEKSGP